MLRLHLTILQELVRLETEEERHEAITGILNLLDDIMDGKLLPEEQEGSEIRGVNPFEGQILWSS